MNSSADSGTLRAGNSREKIAYLRQMLGELRLVARGEGADLLCYLIEMAYVEAGDLQTGRSQLGARPKKADLKPNRTI